MSVSSAGPAQVECRSRRAHRCARANRHGVLSSIGRDVVAHRLRTLGHPTRVALVWSLDRREATIEQLATAAGVSDERVAGHVRVLCRAGILRRVTDAAPARYALADWPSLWLVQQFARRLDHQQPTTIGAPQGEWR